MKLNGRVISVSGIDGSGKTTIIEYILKELNSQERKTRYVWLRYNHYFTKLILIICRLIRLTSYENHNGVRVGYHYFYKSKIISFLFISLTWIDTFIATFFTVYIPAFFGRTVVCDRWIPDILIDLAVDTHCLIDEDSKLYKFFYKLVPKSATLLMVNREFDEIYNAREEHQYDKYLNKRFNLYEELKKSGKCQIIDNTKELDSTLSQVKKVIM
jgi:thymidylate kinase